MKKFLIHLLGGLTADENLNISLCSRAMGEYTALCNLRHFAEQMNGLPADEWCKLMYNHIVGYGKRLEEETSVHDASASGNTTTSND